MFTRSLQVATLAFVILIVAATPRSAAVADEQTGGSTLEFLTTWLHDNQLNDENLKSLLTQAFAAAPLTKKEAGDATSVLWNARAGFLKEAHQTEFEGREIVIGDLKMPFWYKTFGEAPAGGRSLYISMHGGGGAPAAVNDQQYQNQKRLYQPDEGVYLVPRAPTNSWDLWHQSHIDEFFKRLITDMILFENVNPDRVFIMGYSAGGDGVYQLAPRMADRLAAAAMMAGHPNESRPEGLRNIGFTIHVGANDDAYNRNAKAEEWGKLLDALQTDDKEGYVHEVVLHPDRGHWMNLEDAVAVPWMAKFTRNVWPDTIAWIQDDVRHDRYYWLRASADAAKAGDRIMASVEGNGIHFGQSAAASVTVLLNDRMLNLDEPVSITRPDGVTSQHSVIRTIGSIAVSLSERFDQAAAYSSTVDVSMSTDEK